MVCSRFLCKFSYFRTFHGISDIPKLNTIVLASPKSDVVQSVGKNIEADVRKFHPLVIDIKDIHPNISYFQSNVTYIRYYKKSNHDIYLYKTDGSKEKIEKSCFFFMSGYELRVVID